MSKRSAVFWMLLVSCCFLLAAGELWLEPSKFFYNPGEKLVVNFREGVDFAGEHWKVMEKANSPGGNLSHIKKAVLHHHGSAADIREYIGKGEHDLVIPLQAEGTYIIALETAALFSDLEAEEFNAYLREAALDEAYAHRRKTNSLDQNGKELYTHFAKLLVQVGKKTDDTFKKAAGLAAEIIPQQNPYSLKVGDRVQFKIMFKGKPVFGARVKVWNHYNHRTSVQNIFTEQNGMIETHISNPGKWMVSFVKMIPSEDPKADWQSFKGSLVFGIK